MRRSALIALLLVAGCRDPRAVDLDRPLVSIIQVGEDDDGEVRRTISERELRATYARVRFEREGETLRAGSLPVEVKQSALADLIQRKILAAEAERLGVRVLLPLGACVLPAFVLLGVVPVLMAVLGGAGL